MTSTARSRPDVTSTPMVSGHAAAYPLSWLLAVITVIATVLTILLPDVLRGPAAMNGSARGRAPDPQPVPPSP